MPAKKDPRVDAYIGKAAPFAQPILKHLRKLVHAACPDASEDIKWGMPSFIYHGKILVGMAAFKAHATFGFWHRGMEGLLKKELGKTSEAMGSLGRISSKQDLPADQTLRRYLRTAVALHDSGHATRPKRQPRPALPTPLDLAAALKRNRQAEAAWSAFSPGCRREYIEWINEAKRPETRARRLNTTLTWTAAGKARNWQYANC